MAPAPNSQSKRLSRFESLRAKSVCLLSRTVWSNTQWIKPRSHEQILLDKFSWPVRLARLYAPTSFPCWNVQTSKFPLVALVQKLVCQLFNIGPWQGKIGGIRLYRRASFPCQWKLVKENLLVCTRFHSLLRQKISNIAIAQTGTALWSLRNYNILLQWVLSAIVWLKLSHCSLEPNVAS